MSALDHPLYVLPLPRELPCWTPLLCVSSQVWTQSVRGTQAAQLVLEEWKLLVLVDVKFFEVPTAQTDKSDFYMNHTLEAMELVKWNSSSAPDGNTGLLLDEATRSLNDAQQSVHPGTGNLMPWLLCERTCHIGLLCNNKSRSRVHQLLNQAWPGPRRVGNGPHADDTPWRTRAAICND